jgi:hypothetical protein
MRWARNYYAWDLREIHTRIWSESGHLKDPREENINIDFKETG